MSDDISGRERRRIVKDGVRDLRARPGWNPSSTGDRDDRLADSLQAERASQLYDKAAGCAACARARVEFEDATALCDEHLAAALG